MTTIDYIHELVWRGFEYPQGQTETWPLDNALKQRAVAGYCGFDPTADSLHVGSLLPLMGLVHLQRSGNTPVALIGGGTGLIGDPSGKRAERPLADREIIEANARKIQAQIEPFLADGPRVIANNADWLGELNLVEFLRDIGKYFSVNVMLQRESVSSRLQTGISFTEFSYMLLQAYDYLKLHEIHGVNLQIGGSDQWGNILAGVDLIRRVTGDTVHGFTFNLITTASGTKFGKTESGTVWLDAAKTSPYQFYQFWINIDDRDVGSYLRYFTLLDREAIEQLDRERAEYPDRRTSQRTLARNVTDRVHGAEAARSAEDISIRLFSEDFPSLSEQAMDWLFAEIGAAHSQAEEPYVTTGVGVHIDPTNPTPSLVRRLPTVVDLLVNHGLVQSRSEARRQLQQGGVYLNNRRQTSDREVGVQDLLYHKYVLVRRGARQVKLVRFEHPPV